MSVSSSLVCLHDTYVYPGLRYFDTHAKVRVVEYDPQATSMWLEARIVPRLAGILLRDRLGLDVEFIPAQSAQQFYELVSAGIADIALTLWPAKFEGNVRMLARNRTCSRSDNGRCMSVVGKTGYKGRAGWYVPANVTSVREDPQQWAMVTALYRPDYQALLLKAKELPVTDMCGGLSPDERFLPHISAALSGDFNCTDGSWVLQGGSAGCCPRADDARGACDGRPPCIAVLVDSPSFDAGLNEAIVASLAHSSAGGSLVPPGVQIVYGNVGAGVAFAESAAVDRPLLLYSWEPRDELMAPHRFLRITMKSHYECAYSQAGGRFLSTQSDGGVAACDFPMEHVEKAAYWKVFKPSGSPLSHFAAKFAVEAEQLQDLLARAAAYNVSSFVGDAASERIERAACDWLRANEAVWQSSGWIQTQETFWLGGVPMMWASVAFTVFCFCWVFVVEPNCFRCSGTGWCGIGGEHACRGSNKGTTTFGFDLVGLVLRLSRRRATRRHEKIQGGGGRARGSVVKVTDAELTATSGQVEAPQVSFAQRRFVVKKAFTAVELTILRLDSLPDALDVTVSARDASAIYGLDYAGLSAPGEGGGDTHDKAVRATGAARLRRAQSSLTLTFEARQRLRVVYAHINNASQYRGLVRFAVSLRATSRAGGVAVASPVASARVAILECGRFPNGFRDAKGVELSPSKLTHSSSSDGDVDGDSDGDSDDDDDDDGDGSLEELSLIDLRADLRTRSLQPFAALIHQAAGRLHVFSWLPVYHYMREALRWCWSCPGFPVPKPVTFALAQMVSQGVSSFAMAYLYETWLKHGLGRFQLDVAISVACLMLVCHLVNWRVEVLYSGRWDVQRKMQMLLIRKYLSLDELDLDALSQSRLLEQQGGSLEDTFRQAISATAVNLSKDCYLACHYALSSLWGVAFSIVYILYQYSQAQVQGTGSGYGYMLGLVAFLFFLAFVVVVFFVRAHRTWQFWKAKFLANVVQTSTLSFLLAKPALVRAADRVHSIASSMYTQITGTLWADYDSWMYGYLTEWDMRALLYAVTYALWAMGPVLTDPRIDESASLPHFAQSELLALLVVLGRLAASLIAFEKHMTTIFTSGSMVMEVAHLLNYQSRVSLITMRDCVDDDVDDDDARPAGAAAAPHQLLSARRTSTRAESLAELSRAESFDRSEVSGLMMSLKTDAYALAIQDLTFGRMNEAPYFRRLNLFHRPTKGGGAGSGGGAGGLVRVPNSMVPAGRLIGLRALSSSGDVDLELQMLKLLAGWIQPDAGTAQVVTMLSVKLVRGNEFEGMLFRGSLYENLCYGAAEMDERKLWQLCRRVGLSIACVGASYDEGASCFAKHVDPHLWSTRFSEADVGRILLVRAILARPDVLLLHELGDLWTAADQQQLIGVVMAFLDETIEAELFDDDAAVRSARAIMLPAGSGGSGGSGSGGGGRAAGGNKKGAAVAARRTLHKRRLHQTVERKRTVVWAASDPLLISALQRCDALAPSLVLTIQDESHATLSTPAECFPTAIVARWRRAIAKAPISFAQAVRRQSVQATAAATVGASSGTGTGPESAAADGAAEAAMAAVAELTAARPTPAASESDIVQEMPSIAEENDVAGGASDSRDLLAEINAEAEAEVGPILRDYDTEQDALARRRSGAAVASAAGSMGTESASASVPAAPVHEGVDDEDGYYAQSCV